MINLKMYFIILGCSLALSIGLQMILPFPYGLGVTLAIFVLVPILLQRRFNRMGARSPGARGGLFGMGRSRMGSPEVTYSCLVCNNKYKGGSCPRCGSKMKRADF